MQSTQWGPGLCWSAVQQWGLCSTGSCLLMRDGEPWELRDTPWWGRGLRLPPLQWNKETSGQPYVAPLPDGSEMGSCNKRSAVSLFCYIPPSFSMASQKRRASNTQATVAVGKTQVCNLSKYNSVVPIKLKTEKWHKKNVHYSKLQFFICSLLLPHSLK